MRLLDPLFLVVVLDLLVDAVDGDGGSLFWDLPDSETEDRDDERTERRWS